MRLSILDLAVMAVYLGGITAVGLFAARGVRDTHSFFIGGRRFGKALVLAQALGTGTHSDQAIGVMGACYQIGLGGIWYQWMWLFTTPLYWLLAPVFRRLRLITTADFYELRYGPAMGMAYSLFALYLFTLWVALIVKGTATTVQAISGFSEGAIICVVTAIFLAFGVAGGLVAAAVTDFVQSFFIVILSFAILPFGFRAAGGFAGLHQKLPPWMFSLTAPGEMTWFTVLMLVVSGAVGIVAQPHMMAVGSSGKTEMNCRVGWCYGNFVKRLCTVGWALTGLLGAALYPGLDPAHREQIFGLAILRLLPAGLIGLMVASLLATVMSTCSAFIVDGSALFTRNLYCGRLRPGRGEDHYLAVGRVTTLFIALGGVILALYLPSVVAGTVHFVTILPFLGVPFWVGIAWQRANRYGAWVCALGSALLFYGGATLGWSIPLRSLASLAFGVASIIVVSARTPPEPPDRLEKIFLNLHTPVGFEKSGVVHV